MSLLSPSCGYIVLKQDDGNASEISYDEVSDRRTNGLAALWPKDGLWWWRTNENALHAIL